MEKMSFEEAKTEIENIIKRMESGNLPLEESMSQFEKAAKLVKYCQEILDDYKGKIEAIVTQPTE